MPVLYNVLDPKAWVDAWESYRAVVQTLSIGKKTDLQELDRWINEELPASVASRPTPHIKQDELSRIMKWKLMKGKWRPRLQQFVDGIDDATVVTASSKAFSYMADGAFPSAIQALCTLKGVGPATATAILAAYDPSVPFMSDEALMDVVGVCTYTIEDAIALRDALLLVCTRLNASTRFSDGSSWTPQRAQLAIWAAATGAALRAEPIIAPPAIAPGAGASRVHSAYRPADKPAPAISGTKRAAARPATDMHPGKAVRTDMSTAAGGAVSSV